MHKSQNVSKLMYHFAFPVKYLRMVVDEKVEEVIKGTSLEISKRYDLYFLGIGTDKDCRMADCSGYKQQINFTRFE